MNELPTTAGTTNLPTTAEIEVKPPVEKPVDPPPTKTIDNQVKKIVRRKRKVAEVKPVDPPQSEATAPEPTGGSTKWSEPTTTKTVVEGLVNVTLPFCLDKNIRPRRRFLTALRDLTAKQRFGLNVLLEGMKSSGTVIENGAVVNSHVNAIRALLEMVADSASGEIVD